MSEEFEIGLFNHNATAYKAVRKQLSEDNRSCIIHATGTGKSFIALQLMYDFLKDTPDRKVKFLFPINGIGSQLHEYIKVLENIDKSVFNNVEFISYQSLLNMTREELEQLDIDLLVLDEFHHLGAPEWTSRIDIIVNSHPNLKCFGMSATSVRERGTSNEVDVAQTFFKGNVASEYDLASAIADGVLPAPDYHAAVISLEDECAALEARVKSGNSSPEERREYLKLLSKIRKQISKMEAETLDEILSKYLKPDGKYIYFCPQGIPIKELQNNFLEMLPSHLRDNAILYQVHSSEQTEKENEINHYNFYHNQDLQGESVDGKLRVMFSINMYNEGVHVPDIDGVIMGRSTSSEIVFYQQLGRALAVKKSKDGTKEDITPPLVIDFMNNFRNILSLYNKVIDQKSSDKGYSGQSAGNNSGEFFNFGLSEELINVLMELNRIKSKMEFTLSFEEKLEEVYDYFKINGVLPTQSQKEIRFSDDTVMGLWLQNQKQKIYELYLSNDELVTKFALAVLAIKPNYFNVLAGKNLSFEEQLEEAYDYVKTNGALPGERQKQIKFSDDSGTIRNWLHTNRKKIYELYLSNDKLATMFVQLVLEIKPKYFDVVKNNLAGVKKLGFEGQLEEVYDYLKRNGTLPAYSQKEIRFSDDSGSIGMWLTNNKKRIYELYLSGDELASKFGLAVLAVEPDYFNMLAGKKLSFEEKLEEVYCYLKANGTLPTQRQREIRFSDNSSVIGLWLTNNRKKIYELYLSGDELATKFSLAVLEINPKFFDIVRKNLAGVKKLGFEGQFEEVYDYLKKNGTLPTQSQKEIRFSDDSRAIGMWLNDNKKKIYELYLSGDELATKFSLAVLEIKPDYFNMLSGKKLSFEEKLEEVYNYVKTNGFLPGASQKQIKFSDDSGSIRNWLSVNMKKIYGLYLSGDELATRFVHLVLKIRPRYFDNVKNNLVDVKKLSFEERLEEVYGYVKINGALPSYSQKEIRFSDNSGSIGWWLSGNKKKIYELYLSKDELATKFVLAILKIRPDYFNALARKKLGFEGQLEELYDYVKMNGSLPTQRQKEIRFSDDSGVIGWWLSGNKKKIYKLYLSGDELATKFVQLVLEIKPQYFDKIKEALDAETEFKLESKFEEVKEAVSKSPRTVGLKEEKGKCKRNTLTMSKRLMN